MLSPLLVLAPMRTMASMVVRTGSHLAGAPDQAPGSWS
jgi:hypothetical protein